MLIMKKKSLFILKEKPLVEKKQIKNKNKEKMRIGFGFNYIFMFFFFDLLLHISGMFLRRIGF